MKLQHFQLWTYNEITFIIYYYKLAVVRCNDCIILSLYFIGHYIEFQIIPVCYKLMESFWSSIPAVFLCMEDLWYYIDIIYKVNRCGNSKVIQSIGAYFILQNWYHPMYFNNRCFECFWLWLSKLLHGSVESRYRFIILNVIITKKNIEFVFESVFGNNKRCKLSCNKLRHVKWFCLKRQECVPML